LAHTWNGARDTKLDQKETTMPAILSIATLLCVSQAAHAQELTAEQRTA
jgi:hypothetical protein